MKELERPKITDYGNAYDSDDYLLALLKYCDQLEKERDELKEYKDYLGDYTMYKDMEQELQTLKDTMACDHCGDIAWTADRYGKILHKKFCPHNQIDDKLKELIK